MTRFNRLFLALLAVSLAAHTASAGIFNRENLFGAAIGGLAGGIIGHQSDHRTEGALLGSLAGYAVGSVVHDEKTESRETRQEPAHSQFFDEPAPPPPAAPAPEPRFTKSEERQLLLQSSPLFSVKQRE